MSQFQRAQGRAAAQVAAQAADAVAGQAQDRQAGQGRQAAQAAEAVVGQVQAPAGQPGSCLFGCALLSPAGVCSLCYSQVDTAERHGEQTLTALSVRAPAHEPRTAARLQSRCCCRKSVWGKPERRQALQAPQARDLVVAGAQLDQLRAAC